MFLNPLLQAGRVTLHTYIDLCRVTFDLNIEIIKSFHPGKKIDRKQRPLLICLSKYDIKAKILSKSFTLHQMNPYEDLYLCLQTRPRLNKPDTSFWLHNWDLKELGENLMLSFMGIALPLGPNLKETANWEAEI